MHRKRFFRRWGVATGLAALAGVTTVALVVGSDHQDTPFVELNPKTDMTDVYAFPGAAAGRIALVMDTPGVPHPGTGAGPGPGIVRRRPALSVQDRQHRRRERKTSVIQVSFTGDGRQSDGAGPRPARAAGSGRHGESWSPTRRRP